MRWILIGLLTLFSGLPVFGTQNPAIRVKIVKYDELKGAVLDQRGNVIVVDFWSTSCVPCMKAFPHVVDLQHKYGNKGLTVISVNLDELTAENETKVVDRVFKFLQKRNARFTNVILDESGDVLLKKLRLRSIPCVYVFDRQRKWKKFQDADFDIQAIEQTVVRFLEKK